MVSFGVNQGTVDLTAARGGAFEDFHRNLFALCDLQEKSLLELLRGGSSQYRLRLSPTVCLDLGPSAGKGIAASGPLDYSWFSVDTVDFAECNSYVEAWTSSICLCVCRGFPGSLSNMFGCCGRQLSGAKPWKLGAVLDLATNFAAQLLPQATG